VLSATKLHARLTVIDGKVPCPTTGHWEQLGHCTHCSEFIRTEGENGAQAVVCTPQVESLATAVEDIARR